MQRKLRAFAHRADEQADARHRDQHPVGAAKRIGKRQLGQLVGFAEGFGVTQGAAISHDQADAENEAEITHPVDQKRLHVGEDRCRPGVPEADQQVAHQADRLPAKKQLQKVIAHHQHQHAEGEQRDIREKALVAGVVHHIADGVDVHHQRDKGDHHHHHRTQAIDQKADFHLQPAAWRIRIAKTHPFINRGIEAGAGQHVIEHHRRQHERNQHAEDGDRVGAGPADGFAEEAGDHRARQRRQRYRQQQVLRKLSGHIVLVCPDLSP